MATEDESLTAKTKEGQAEFLTGSVVEGRLGSEFLNEESLRRGFALALGVDPNIGTSQSSCHFARALIQSGVVRLSPGERLSG